MPKPPGTPDTGKPAGLFQRETDIRRCPYCKGTGCEECGGTGQRYHAAWEVTLPDGTVTTLSVHGDGAGLSAEARAAIEAMACAAAEKMRGA